MNVLIKNAENTSDLELPDGYSSWREYWSEEADFICEDTTKYECPACKEAFLFKDFDGAHVQKVFDKTSKMYLIPLCGGCNHKGDAFWVDENLLVQAP